MKKQTDYSFIGAVCDDCAKAAGFTPKDKAVGMWMGECEICRERKWCANLWHDWNPPNNNNQNKKGTNK